MQTTPTVSWNTYAQKYDMLLSFNPFYQELHQDVMDQIKQWEIRPGDCIADIGAGTGNYSLAMARYFPMATVLHFDRDEGMNARTAEKKKDTSISNHMIFSKSVDEIALNPSTLRGLISIHALYTFPDPTRVLQRMFDLLEAGGSAVLVDAGRIVNVLDWQLSLSWHLLREHGIWKTLEVFREGKEVSRQNAYIRNMQRNGTFWTHNHLEFCETVESVGFEIVQHKTCFRGISDFVVARKPNN